LKIHSLNLKALKEKKGGQEGEKPMSAQRIGSGYN